MEKKYKLTEETIAVNNKTLYRIEALKDFNNVKKGDKGGFIEKVANLSHFGNTWVFGKAKVYDNARVCGNAIVFGNAIVCGNAKVCDNAKVYGNARIYGITEIGGNAEVYGDTLVYDIAEVYDNTKVCNKASVCGNARIYGDAIISSNKDYIIFKNWWSSGRYFTWTRSNNMWKVGCFYGTGKELVEKAYKDSELSGREYKRIVKYVESIIKEE